MPARPGAGRPEFQPTAELRDKVELLRACGMSVEDIARAIGIARTTLEKHFSEELQMGPARKRAEFMGWLTESAKKGNVSAQKKLIELVDAKAAREEREEFLDAASVKTKVGKKEQAAIDAQTAGDGTGWERYLRDDNNNPGVKPN
jgi:transposase-like protein